MPQLYVRRYGEISAIPDACARACPRRHARRTGSCLDCSSWRGGGAITARPYIPPPRPSRPHHVARPPHHARQRTRPRPPRRQRAPLEAARGGHDVQGVPRGACAGTVAGAVRGLCADGGRRASTRSACSSASRRAATSRRRPTPACVLLCARCRNDLTRCAAANTRQPVHGLDGEAAHRAHARAARRARHDRRPAHALPVRVPVIFAAHPTADLQNPCSTASVYHLGIFREKVTLQPVECTS